MSASRGKVQRERVGRGAGNDTGKRLGNNASYRPEPAQEVVVGGVRCINLDGGRIADAADIAREVVR